jgi:hypothetical protein
LEKKVKKFIWLLTGFGFFGLWRIRPNIDPYKDDVLLVRIQFSAFVPPKKMRKLLRRLSEVAVQDEWLVDKRECQVVYSMLLNQALRYRSLPLFLTSDHLEEKVDNVMVLLGCIGDLPKHLEVLTTKKGLAWASRCEVEGVELQPDDFTANYRDIISRVKYEFFKPLALEAIHTDWQRKHPDVNDIECVDCGEHFSVQDERDCPNCGQVPFDLYAANLDDVVNSFIKAGKVIPIR